MYYPAGRQPKTQHQFGRGLGFFLALARGIQVLIVPWRRRGLQLFVSIIVRRRSFVRLPDL